MEYMETELTPWLIRELDTRGWSQRELGRRAGISQTTVSQVLSYQRQPTWDFCASIARAFRVPEDEVFRLAGLKPPLPPAVANWLI
jgi:transcriptional regulator with XRE-family HTH domain